MGAANQPELVSSDLLQTELVRAVHRNGTAQRLDIDDGLAAIDLLPATTSVLELAGRLEPSGLRTLDAVHLATAIGIVDDCDGVITYDDRLADAARHHGLTAIGPA